MAFEIESNGLIVRLRCKKDLSQFKILGLAGKFTKNEKNDITS